MKARDIWGRIQKTIKRWNHSVPEQYDGTATADQNPEATEAILRTLYGRFIHINVGMNRKERRAAHKRLRTLHAADYKNRTDIAPKKAALAEITMLSARLKDNTKNREIKVYREHDGKNGIVKYSLNTNPYYVPRPVTA